MRHIDAYFGTQKGKVVSFGNSTLIRVFFFMSCHEVEPKVFFFFFHIARLPEVANICTKHGSAQQYTSFILGDVEFKNCQMVH